VTKLAAEHLCLLYAAVYELPVTALRYFSVYGPRQRPDMAFQRFCEAVASRKPLTVFGDGTQTRDFTFVGDIVAATRAAAELKRESRGVTLNIGGGFPISLNRVIEILEKLSGRRLDVQRSEPQRGDVRHTAADISRARDVLGYEPRTSLESGLSKQWEWARTVLR
jgi:UDP-glucose 4-epimerase